MDKFRKTKKKLLPYAFGLAGVVIYLVSTVLIRIQSTYWNIIGSAILGLILFIFAYLLLNSGQLILEIATKVRGIKTNVTSLKDVTLKDGTATRKQLDKVEATVKSVTSATNKDLARLDTKLKLLSNSLDLLSNSVREIQHEPNGKNKISVTARSGNKRIFNRNWSIEAGLDTEIYTPWIRSETGLTDLAPDRQLVFFDQCPSLAASLRHFILELKSESTQSPQIVFVSPELMRSGGGILISQN